MLIKQDIIADEITFKEKSEKNEHVNGSEQGIDYEKVKELKFF